MPRLARVVVPGLPHHVTQRGSRSQRTFFSHGDYACYLRVLSELRGEAGVEVWAYCLMPNHIHCVVVPQRRESLARYFREVHRRYAARVNAREGWRGHLWQERFHSCVLDERHLMAAVRYVELNPVRAALCSRARDWRWSSVRAHLRCSDDSVVRVRPMLDRVGDWEAYVAADVSELELAGIREHSRTGRPLGASPFVERLEQLTGRRLKKAKPGPKRPETRSGQAARDR